METNQVSSTRRVSGKLGTFTVQCGSSPSPLRKIGWVALGEYQASSAILLSNVVRYLHGHNKSIQSCRIVSHVIRILQNFWLTLVFCIAIINNNSFVKFCDKDINYSTHYRIFFDVFITIFHLEYYLTFMIMSEISRLDISAFRFYQFSFPRNVAVDIFIGLSESNEDLRLCLFIKGDSARGVTVIVVGIQIGNWSSLSFISR